MSSLLTRHSREHAHNGPLQEFPSVRGILLALAALLTLSGVIGLFAALSYKETKRVLPGNERITLDHVFNGTFAAARTGLSWVPEGVPKSATFVIVELTVSPIHASRRRCFLC